MLTVGPDVSRRLNKLVWQVFTKGFGMTLQADAAAFLVDKIAAHGMDDTQTTEFLTYLAQNYGKISKDLSGMVSRANIELVFAQVYSTHDSREKSGQPVNVCKFVKVIDAFATPKHEYDVHAKAFRRTERAAGLFGAAEEKVLVFLRRFNLLRQRISKQLRNGALLLGPSVSSLTPIKSIKGISAPERVYCVLGALTEMVEGALFLEDPEDSIELDLSQLRDEPDNLVLEGNIVLVRGVCLGKRLLVERLIMPPAEPRAETLAMLTHPDMSEATSFAEPTHELRELEQQAQSARIVVMSDVWLDQPRILERFKMLFDGFNGQGHLPEIFVLIGPFSSNPPKDGPRAWSHYQDLFDNFAALVERVKNARHTRFIFVPGATDPGFAESLLPRNSIPEPIFDAWRRAKLDYVSTTNPCRIIYFTQEIVICRQELTTRMRTCALNGFIRAAAASCEKANSDAEMTACVDEHKSAGTLHSLPTHQLAMKAILDQASLVPVAQTTQAHIWSLDHSLALYPIPDLLVVAERQQCHEFTYRDCICANPGAFPSAEGTFFVYNPAKRMLEMSELPG